MHITAVLGRRASCWLLPLTQRRLTVVTRRRHVPSQWRYFVLNCMLKTSPAPLFLSAFLLSAVISKKKQKVDAVSSAAMRNELLRPAPIGVELTFAPPFAALAPQPSMPCTHR